MRPVPWRRDLSEQEAKGSQRMHQGNNREERADWGNETDGDEDNMEIKKEGEAGAERPEKGRNEGEKSPGDKGLETALREKKQGKLE